MYRVPDQSGKTFIVTGSNSGTGKEAAKRLAVAGARVIMAVRSMEKGEAARREILVAAPGADIQLRHVDLADLASVRQFANEILDDGTPIDTLVNNAGVMAPPQRMTTADGFELQFGSNFLGPFALTNLLLPRILESRSPRVATMSSFVAHFGRIHFDDLQATRRYQPYSSYAQSKLADMLMAQHLARVADARGWVLLSTIAHPGYTRTNLQTSGANLGRTGSQKQPVQRTLVPSQTVERGAEPLLFAAASPTAEQSGYYGPSGVLGLVGATKKVTLPRNTGGDDLAGSLWAVAENLTATTLPVTT